MPDEDLRNAAILIVKKRWIGLYKIKPEEIFSEEEIIAACLRIDHAHQ